MFPAIMSVTYIRLYHTTDVKLSLWRSGAGDARINISPMQKRAAGAGDSLVEEIKILRVYGAHSSEFQYDPSAEAPYSLTFLLCG